MMNYFERLYLSKDIKDSKQNIYVDKCPLVQHQLDGIRYLYRAFKKKKQAVILNDPSGYGKRVQTVLFLSAVLPTLMKPVLILCREDKEHQWMSYFQQWTQVSDDAAIELSNPFVKKKVLISASYCAAAFARRHWSVLVVDEDLSKDIQKSSLRADLRIWITSSVIKNDLAKYSTFHSWVNPKEKFVADKYKADTTDLRDILLKTAMLDALLEDTVLRRNYGVAPFTKTQDSISNNIKETIITKKNKDATGTKIKRSKRISTHNTEDTPTKVARTTKNTIENTELFEIGVTDVENQTNEPKNTKDYEMADINDADNFAPLSRNKSKQSCRIWDSEDSEEITNLQKDKDTVSQVDESGEQLNGLRWDSDTDSENSRKDTSRLDINRESTPSTELVNLEASTNDEIRVIEVDNINELENSGSLLQNSIELHDMNNEIIDKINPLVNSNKFSEDLFSTDLSTNNEINVKLNEIESKADKLTSPNNVNESERSTKTIKHVELNEKTDQKQENANLSFDMKMKQLEELAMKKYKGSSLDSMFSRLN